MRVLETQVKREFPQMTFIYLIIAYFLMNLVKQSLNAVKVTKMGVENDGY